MGDTPQVAGQEIRRFIVGDALRGIVCVGILLFHAFAAAGNVFLNDGDRTAFADFGWSVDYFQRADTLVWVFFMLSGYLLARPFIRSLVRDKPLPDVRKYAKNRVLRVVPAFWVVTIAALLLIDTEDGGVRNTALLFAMVHPYFDAFTQGPLEQSWTLGVELVYYILLPLTAFVLWRTGQRGTRAVRWIVAILVVMCVSSILIRAAWVGDLAGLRTFPAAAFAFVPGIAFALAEVLYRDRMRGLRWGPPVAALAMAMCVAIYVVAAQVPDDQRALLHALTLASASCFVGAPLLLQWTANRAWRFLDNPVMNWLGTRSYPIYLVHVAIISQTVDLMLRAPNAVQGWLLCLVVSVPASFVGAEIVHRVVERPLLRRREQWRPAQMVPATAAGVPAAPPDEPVAARPAPAATR